MNIAIQIVSARGKGEDRAAAFSTSDRHVLVVADGAGGTSNGAAAADLVIAAASTATLCSSHDCVRLLQRLDADLKPIGQSTAVLAVVAAGEVFGASAGDSCAWLIRDDDVHDLTEHQRKKPLLGSGNAAPIGFGPVRCEGRLLVGSDGLFKYVPYARICDLARSVVLADAPTELVAAARLSSGTLQDDVSVIVAG